jgi:hypothetical protein
MPTAIVNSSAIGDNTLVSGVAGSAVRVTSFCLSFGSAVNVKFKDGATSDLTGLLYALGTAPLPIRAAPSGANARGHFQTSKGNALVLNLSAAIAVGGWIVYELAPQ